MKRIVSRPSAAQVRWREWVRSQGCICGLSGPVEIHHIAGRTGRHNKVSIGHWLIVPVSNAGHRQIERLPKFEQIQMFLREVAEPYWRSFGVLPFGADELLAMVTWR